MKKYILKRLLTLIPVLFGITFITFALMHLAGSDAITELYSDKGAVNEAIIDAKRAELGLDKPFLQQYFSWLVSFFQGNMGVSYVSGVSVLSLFMAKLPATLFLAIFSLMITVVVALPLGVFLALHHNTFIDYLIRLASFAGNCLPGFFVALILMQIFSIHWQVFPVVSSGISIKSAALPALTLSIAMTAKYLRQIRSAVLEELGQDYVAAARAYGVRNIVVIKSVLRTAMTKIITMLALSLGSLLGGTAVVETIFMWDGVGKMAVDAITMRDYPIIQAYVAWMAIIYVAVNLLADIICQACDPRIRLMEEHS